MKRWRISASFPPPSVHLPREGRLKEPPGGHIEQHDYLIILSLDFTHTKKNSIQVTCVCVSRVCNSVCVAALERSRHFVFVVVSFIGEKEGKRKLSLLCWLPTQCACGCVSLSHI